MKLQNYSFSFAIKVHCCMSIGLNITWFFSTTNQIIPSPGNPSEKGIELISESDKFIVGLYTQEFLVNPVFSVNMNILVQAVSCRKSSLCRMH